MAETSANILTASSSHADWLPPEEVRQLTVEKVTSNLRDASAAIAAEATQAEKQRFPTERAWSLVRRSGLFYLTVPAERGGVGARTTDAFYDPILTIAECCMSTAWCAVQSLQHQWLIGLFPEQFQQEVWGKLPYLTSAGSAFPMARAVEADGGYRVSGHFRWGSGILYAQWVFVMAVVKGADDRARSVCLFMPVTDVTILDSWFMDGMAGSGSHDFIVDNVFVPTHRSLDGAMLNFGQPARANPLQRAPLPVLASSFVPVPILGAARSIVRAYRARLTAEGVDIGPTGRRGDHVTLARAEMALQFAEMAIRDSARRIGDWLQTGTPIPDEPRMALRAQSAYAVSLCRQAARDIMDISGSTAHGLGNPSQRALRDITVLSTHPTVDLAASMDVYGRQLVGLPIEYFRRT
jgi:alkylation response protein AidB-like acyl-CoA dehydrogenase